MSDLPICECATFWEDHHPECPVRAEITHLRAGLEAERERSEHYSDLLSQWRETWNNGGNPDGDLLDDTDAAVEGGRYE